MRKLLTLFAALSLLVLYSPQRYVESQPAYLVPRRFVNVVGIDDTTDSINTAAPLFLVKYVGTLAFATVDLNVNALEFFSGATTGPTSAGDAVEVNVGDVCGTANGALDVTDTECDTPDELVNVINNSGAPWVAVLVGAIPTETTATAAEFIDPADGNAKINGGLAIYIDHSAVDAIAVLLTPWSGRYDTEGLSPNINIEPFIEQNPTSTTKLQKVKLNPFAGREVFASYVYQNTDTTGAAALEVYSVRADGAGGYTARLLWSEATTDVTDLNRDFSRTPFGSGQDQALLVRVVDDALVTATVAANGFATPEGK